MFPGKKALNMGYFTAIRNLPAADICQMHANAVAASPGETIVVARLDIASACNSIHVRPKDVPLGARSFSRASKEKHT